MPTNDAKIFLAQKPPASRWLWAVAVLMLGLSAGAGWFYFSPDTSEPVAGTLPAPPPKRIDTIAKPVEVPKSNPVLPILPVPAQPDPVREPRQALAALDPHLLLYLPLTSSLDDQSSHHVALESSGSISVHGGAAHFPGDSFLTLPHIALNNRPFALSVWIKPEGTVVGYGILEQVDGGPGKHLHILLRDPDKPYIGFYLDDLRSSQSIQPTAGWTHLTLQFTGTHQQIWINGMLSVERNSNPYLGEKGETRIGKAPMWNNVPSQCFKGSMRDLRLYDITLTPQHIRLLAGLDAGDAELKKNKPDDAF